MSTLLTKPDRYLYKAPFAINALSVELQAFDEEHPNKAPFRGCLTRLNEASTRPPGGASGHRVQISTEVAQQALNSLTGMPIDFAADLADHDKTQVIGVIERGYIDGNNLMVEGYLLPKNWPTAVEEIRRNKHSLGMSYEISSVEVEDTNSPIWNLTSLIFTGAAILKKAAAAYQDTSIAATAPAQEDDAVEKEVLDKLQVIGAKLDGLQAAMDATEDENASADEAEASSQDAAAQAAVTAAQRARADGDEEDAARQDTLAAGCHTKAFQARMKASQWHAAMASKAQEAGNAEAATQHQADATRLAAAATASQEAAKAVQAAQEAREAAAQAATEEASSETQMARLFASMLQGMQAMEEDASEEDAQADPLKRKAKPLNESMMGRMMAAMVQAMTFQPGVTMSKRKVAAAHDDEAEDKALIRRMLKQDKGTMAAAATTDLVTRRKLRDLQASVELLTDAVSKLTGLLTDGPQPRTGLITDSASRGPNGGAAPQRRSMQGTGGEHFIDKYADSRNGAHGKKTTETVTKELIARGITDTREQMQHIVELQLAGQLAD